MIKARVLFELFISNNNELRTIILHTLLAEEPKGHQSHQGFSSEPVITSPTTTATIRNLSNANQIIVSTARIESGEKNVLLNQLIKEKVTSVHNGMLCLLCGKVIRQNSNIRRHFRDRHLHEGVHYNCPQCQKTYKSRNTFSSHISTMHRDWGKIDLHDFAIPAAEI